VIVSSHEKWWMPTSRNRFPLLLWLPAYVETQDDCAFYRKMIRERANDCQIKCELRIFDYLAVTHQTNMQLLMVINLDKAQVKFSRVRTFKSWDFEDLLFLSISLRFFWQKNLKRKIVFSLPMNSNFPLLFVINDKV
jgi:hypothetical protein